MRINLYSLRLKTVKNFGKRGKSKDDIASAAL